MSNGQICSVYLHRKTTKSSVMGMQKRSDVLLGFEFGELESFLHQNRLHSCLDYIKGHLINSLPINL